tara:strand:- start:8 stop:247 length:240 start_codon:yes stop_codon:yes gene_type:complete
MKIIMLFAAALSLSACAATTNSTAENGAKPMKQYASIEQVRCPKARYHSVKKRLECKQKVRAELNEQSNQSEASDAEAR